MDNDIYQVVMRQVWTYDHSAWYPVYMIMRGVQIVSAWISVLDAGEECNKLNLERL